MKKVFLSIGAAMFIALTVVNVNIAVKGESVAKLSLKNIIALADVEDDDPIDGGEIPEVEIICDGNAGICWKLTCEMIITPHGPMLMGYCSFTGRQSDYCTSDMSCD